MVYNHIGTLMYKALHTQTGEEIIILHPLWLKRIDDLRAMDQADWLVCQGCRQPLRVKAGEFKRPHFAHKHLQACSYGTESPEILNARAELYGWLLERFGKAGDPRKGSSGERFASPDRLLGREWSRGPWHTGLSKPGLSWSRARQS